MNENHTACAINMCGQYAIDIDPLTGFPLCHDCLEFVLAEREGLGTASLWDVAADGFKLGLFAGVPFGIGHGW